MLADLTLLLADLQLFPPRPRRKPDPSTLCIGSWSSSRPS